MSIKSFDELDITDPIMFGLVFSNKHIAQPFIEHLLGIKIGHLETPIPEAVLSYKWSTPRNSLKGQGTTKAWATE